MDFSEDQVHRYARHILLREVGGDGQAQLLRSKVLVVGAGGLGSPVLAYLTAAGVGTIGIIDDDRVDLSNLQRQIVHFTDDIGLPKVESAKKTLQRLNPDVRIETHRQRLTADNALSLFNEFDLVSDGSDNFATRYLVNDAAFFARKPLVSGAILRFDGQLATFKPRAGPGLPCYRCIYREPPADGEVPSCAQAGVLGALCGMIGAMQATEILKELLGIGESMAGHLMIVDALSMNLRKIKVGPDPGCPLCGQSPTITDLSAHD